MMINNTGSLVTNADEELEPLWECSICSHKLWNESDDENKPIGLNVAIANSDGQVAGLPFEVCPKCRSLTLNSSVFTDLQKQMSSKIIEAPKGMIIS